MDVEEWRQYIKYLENVGNFYGYKIVLIAVW